MHTQKKWSENTCKQFELPFEISFLNSSNINVVDLFQEFHMDQG